VVVGGGYAFGGPVEGRRLDYIEWGYFGQFPVIGSVREAKRGEERFRDPRSTKF